jgi:hypothetical protein
MTTVVLMLLLGFNASQEGQERPPTPKDSIELTVIGCLKGRVLAASDVRQTDVQSGPIVRSRSFRLAAKKDVMKDIKSHDKHLVEVTGLIKKSAVAEPGLKIGGTRIVVGGGSRTGGPNTIPDPADNIVVMDVSSVRMREASCGPER